MKAKVLFLKSKLILFWLPLIILFVFISSQDIEFSKPKIIIRFDDYGVWCNKDWLQIEEEIISLHEKYDVKLICAVIPDSRYPLTKHIYSPQFYPDSVEGSFSNPYPLCGDCRRVELLRESTKRGITEVALHGYYHPKGYSNIGKNTEFYHVPYDVQYKKILYGKIKLDSLFCTTVTTFIPPHNTYDNLTLDLLHEFGFNCVSAKLNDYDAPCDNRLSIRYLWQTSVDVEDFLKVLRLNHYNSEPVQVLALHHTNFTTNGKIDENKIKQYELLLKYISEHKIPNFTFSSFPDKEMRNNHLYEKYVYYTFLNRIGTYWAAKMVMCTNIISIGIIYLMILFSFSMFIVGTLLMFFSLFRLQLRGSRKWKVLPFVFVLLLIMTYLIQAYSISSYNLIFSLFSIRFLILITLLSISLSILLVKKCD